MSSKARTRHKKEQMRLALPAPRNPVALAARQRQAGSHRKSASALRQQAARRVARALKDGSD